MTSAPPRRVPLRSRGRPFAHASSRPATGLRSAGSRRLAPAPVIALAVLLSGCFPGPVRDLWPPEDGEARYRIEVVDDGWHTVVVEPVDAARPPGEVSSSDSIAHDSQTPPPLAPRRHLAWEFAEKRWYLDGEQGVTDVLRALFWPSTSALAREPTGRPYQPPAGSAGRWTFVVSARGLERLHDYATSLLGDPIPGRPAWHYGERSYHLFFLCHHFTLRALREAGLPVAPWWGFTGWMTRIQLDRVTRMHEREGLLKGPPRPAPPQTAPP